MLRPRLTPLRRLSTALHRAGHGVTLGVRGLVLDKAGQILLVEHTYLNGWYLPGGGVERGESAERALTREMVEEAGVVVEGAPRLVSIHNNGRRFSGDFVLLYRVEQWTQTQATAHGEIARIGFFPAEALPDGVTPATRRRIQEASHGAPPDLTW